MADSASSNAKLGQGSQNLRRVHHLALHWTERQAKALAPYLLALTVFAITAHWTLNPVAAGYADKLFTLALVAIRLNNPPSPPAAP